MSENRSTAGSSIAFLQGGGEMGERMRKLDWSQTSLGSPETWPQSLKTAVRIMLTSRQPMFVWWGDELINLYNDAYRSIVGGRHPWALGIPASDVWKEIWDQIRPRAESAMRKNEGTYDEALQLIMERNGYPEETYYTFSYSPVPSDDGGTGGILCANTDDTQAIIGERQLTLLRDLAARAADAKTVDSACELCSSSLATNPYDLPFAMIYLVDADARRVVLAAAAGISHCHSVVPRAVHFDEDSVWPFRQAIVENRVCYLPELGEVDRSLPGGAWERAPHHGVVAPIAGSGQSNLAGLLVAGLNPFRLFDDRYLGFIQLVSTQIAASLANAQAYEIERKRAESLAELDRAKTTFFSNVSHEFRTPLTLMLGPLDDILSKPRAQVPAEIREPLKVVYRNSQRLLKLVNTLLDFTRIEAGRVKAIFEPVDLGTYTAELASMFQSAVDRAGLALRIDAPPTRQPVYVDREMWEKIVLNLISNAFKYTLEGEIKVTLRLEDDSAVLTVHDTGTGIPRDEIPKLFHRFHRVERVHGRTHEGTGIGLALVAELAKLHRGSVSVESQFGQGSTFRVTVPLGTRHLPSGHAGRPSNFVHATTEVSPFVEEALRWLPVSEQEEPNLLHSASTSHALAAAIPVKGSRPRVLLADDNSDMRLYVQRLLQPQYDVIDVTDGQQAFDVAKRLKPDLILSDVMMPKLDGFGLLKLLRSDPQTASLPFIMLSARAGEESRVEGLQAGADDYLTKPFSARELLARVAGMLELAKVRREAQETLRESEERFRNMADHAPVMIWVTEEDGRCSFLSKSWYDFTGQAPGSGLDYGWVEAIHPDDRQSAHEMFVAANAEKLPFRMEYRFRRFDGEYRWAIDAAAPRFASDGRFLGFIGSIIDITERKEMEEALRETDRRKDEFLATLAHELRNPLAPIRNSLHILRMAGDGPAIERVHEMMERQVSHMVRLVDDLLEVSRITRGKIDLRRERIELAAIVRSALDTSKPLIEAARHQLAISLPSEPMFLYVDAVRMSQVIANLLTNAAKYTDEGGQIWLSAQKMENSVLLSVRDNGMGISEEKIPTVFDLFTQIESSLGKAQGGLGIGLTLVKRLVEMHGGAVEARSDGLGAGSEFSITLPLAEESPSRRVASGAKLVHRPIEPSEQRVLVVDDNRDAAESLGMLLRLLGVQVHVVNDGQSALEALERFKPTVALLDLGMPEMDGCELAGLIRQRPECRDISLIALTGWGQPEDRQRSRSAGFDHHFVKPIDIDALQTLLLGGGRSPAR